MEIFTADGLKAALERGKYAWPGGYPCYFLTADGEALSFEAVESNLDVCLDALANPCPSKNDWRILGVEINWEDPELYCAHTNERIESAYAEDD